MFPQIDAELFIHEVQLSAQLEDRLMETSLELLEAQDEIADLNAQVREYRTVLEKYGWDGI